MSTKNAPKQLFQESLPELNGDLLLTSYLHGFVERRDLDPQTEQYVAFFADQPTPDDERSTFEEAWDYIQSRQPCVIYYYSPYERATWCVSTLKNGSFFGVILTRSPVFGFLPVYPSYSLTKNEHNPLTSTR